MFKPTQMTKLRIVGPKSKQKDVVENLYKQNICHILEHKKTDDLDIGSPAEISDKLSDLLVKVRSLISNLNIEKKDIKKIKYNNHDIIEQSSKTSVIEEEINGLYEDVSLLVKKNEELNLEHEFYMKNLEAVELLRSFNVTLKNLIETESIDFLIGSVKNISELKKNIVKKFKGLDIKIFEDKIFLVFDKNKKEDVLQYLSNYNFNQYDLIFLADFEKVLSTKEEINKKIVEIDKEISSNDEILKKYSRQNAKVLLSMGEYLEKEIVKANVPLKFASTNDAFFITGYVPIKKLAQVKRRLEVVTERNIYFQESKFEKDEKIPVEMDNPTLSRPFEFLMHLYSLPKTNEIDPTRIMGITFPIFFGFMLGDVIYGIILLLFFSFMKKVIPNAKSAFNILVISALGTIFFGLMYGEYLGYEEVHPVIAENMCDHAGLCLKAIDASELHHGEGHDTHEEAVSHDEDIEKTEHSETGEVHSDENSHNMDVDTNGEKIYLTPKLMSRVHQLNDLLAIAILIGIFHLFIGFVLGFINIFDHHGLKHAIMEKAGWILLIPGLIHLLLMIDVIKGDIAIILEQILPSSMIIYAITGMGALLIILGEGFIGAIELPAILSNTLSYARLMAVGLASVQLALVVNKFAGEMFHTGGLTIIGGILILVIGHFINILLGLIGPFLHSLRLHYVEFFSKFFKGGGILYQPFGEKESNGDE